MSAPTPLPTASSATPASQETAPASSPADTADTADKQAATQPSGAHPGTPTGEAGTGAIPGAITIAIDGFSACGKSTTAKAVARALGYVYIDTGAMYRAVTLYFLEHFVPLDSPGQVARALESIQVSFRRSGSDGQNEVHLNGINVEREIRKMYISDQVSEVSALPAVRHAMVREQQRMGAGGGLVMDGRDIGTRVFPDAELKIFMTSDMDIRSERRRQELAAKKQDVEIEEVRRNLAHRDHIDSTRAESPLTQARDAILLDNSTLTMDEQVAFVLALARERIRIKAARDTA